MYAALCDGKDIAHRQSLCGPPSRLLRCNKISFLQLLASRMGTCLHFDTFVKAPGTLSVGRHNARNASYGCVITSRETFSGRGECFRGALKAGMEICRPILRIDHPALATADPETGGSSRAVGGPLARMF